MRQHTDTTGRPANTQLPELSREQADAQSMALFAAAGPWVYSPPATAAPRS